MEIIIDSNLSRPDAIGLDGSASLKATQEVHEVHYWGFDNLEHLGQVVIHKELAADVKEWFKLAYEIKFPIEKVIPASQFGGDDSKLMSLNISSGFNYRKIAGTNQMSMHAKGRAFDINPVQNPYIRRTAEGTLIPPNAHWDMEMPGTLYHDHELVQFLLQRGWEWGGDWNLAESGRVDYQHFEKT